MSHDVRLTQWCTHLCGEGLGCLLRQLSFVGKLVVMLAICMLLGPLKTTGALRFCACRYAIMSDGCMMEGLTNEAASLAGHWGLGKLIVFYDQNKISIDGDTNIAFTEDVSGKRCRWS